MIQQCHAGRNAVERWTPERRRALTRDALDAARRPRCSPAGGTRAPRWRRSPTRPGSRAARSTRTSTARRTCSSRSPTATSPSGCGRSPNGWRRAGSSSPPDLATLWRETVIGATDDLALHMEVRLYALRNPTVKARLAEHQRTTRTTLAAFITEQTDGGRLRPDHPGVDSSPVCSTPRPGASPSRARSTRMTPRCSTSSSRSSYRPRAPASGSAESLILSAAAAGPGRTRSHQMADTTHPPDPPAAPPPL